MEKRNIEETWMVSDGKVVTSTSEIYSRLIQEAARWCESYASDIIHDIRRIDKALDMPVTEWGNARADGSSFADSVGTLQFTMGFRRSGVDAADYIKQHFRDGGNADYYRSIWMLTITADMSKGTATARLERRG